MVFYYVDNVFLSNVLYSFNWYCVLICSRFIEYIGVDVEGMCLGVSV